MIDIVLAIESSCDETAVAIYSNKSGLLSHVVHSQIDLHQLYGGVVPEIAARDHLNKIMPLIQRALDAAQLDVKQVDGIAYTKGPGLIGSLMVGATVGCSLAFALGLPVTGVHHLEAHLMAVMLEDDPPEYPFLALLVSGGHTQLIQVRKFADYTLLGESVDDAAGEAFDKTAKLLGLSYPGGPAVAQLAELGDANRFQFPRPMTDRPGLDFSFSGLKTAAVNTYQKFQKEENCAANIACAFQEAVVDTLLIKCRRALKQTNDKRLVLVGGVSANRLLREKFSREFSASGVDVFYPRHEFCTDNAAMVAYTGALQFEQGKCSDDLSIAVKARWPLSRD